MVYDPLRRDTEEETMETRLKRLELDLEEAINELDGNKPLLWKIREELLSISSELDSILFEMKNSKELVKWKMRTLYDHYYMLMELGVEGLNIETMKAQVIRKLDVVKKLGKLMNRLFSLENELDVSSGFHRILSDLEGYLDGECESDFETVEKNALEAKEWLKTIYTVIFASDPTYIDHLIKRCADIGKTLNQRKEKESLTQEGLDDPFFSKKNHLH